MFYYIGEMSLILQKNSRSVFCAYNLNAFFHPHRLIPFNLHHNGMQGPCMNDFTFSPCVYALICSMASAHWASAFSLVAD